MSKKLMPFGPDTKDLHLHRRLEVAEIHFDLPALFIQRGEFDRTPTFVAVGLGVFSPASVNISPNISRLAVRNVLNPCFSHQFPIGITFAS